MHWTLVCVRRATGCRAGPRFPRTAALARSMVTTLTPRVMTADNAQQLNRALGGRYEIAREIGRGGMAMVYLARDVKHSRNVALKVLDPELGAVLGAERFLSEIRVTANLQHPNLLPLFDSGEAAGLLFYVMPFIEGESLRAHLERERQLPIDDAVRIATAVAGALDYAHGHGVIHRDLKPENILLQHGQPVVADFGIALAVSNAGGARVTQTGLSLGTPQYMSPEQATGDRAIDARSDIYSLGAVTYEMLTGEPPHTGTTAQAVVAKLMTEEARAVSVLRRLVPEYVDAAVARALEKLPADRFATAAQFADALNGKSGVPPVRNGTRGSRSSSRSHLRDPFVVGLALTTLAALGALAWERRTAVAPREGFAVKYVIPPGDNERDLNSGGLAISADGRQVAYSTTKAGISIIMLRRANDLSPHAIPGTEGGNFPFFSADGRSVLFVAGSVLRRVSLASGGVATLANASRYLGGDWGTDEDGHALIVVSLDYRLMRIPLDGGAPTPLLPPRKDTTPESPRAPMVMPDGRHVIYTSVHGQSDESRIAVASIGSGEVKYLGIQGRALGFVDGYLVFARAPQGIFAVPFDVRRLEVTGEPVPVLDNVDIVTVYSASSFVRAAVSRSGSVVYRTGAVTSQLVTVDAAHPDAAPRALFTESRDYSFPRFSPDGKRIAVGIRDVNATDVWVYDLASGTPVRVSHGRGRNDRPEWTPDGRQVLYESAGEGTDGLVVRNVDLSGEPRRLVVAGEGVISPDGRTLVFRDNASATTGSDIWYRNVTGDTTRHVLAATPRNEMGPRFSADGKWVAYGSVVEGAWQVYVQPFPPTGSVNKVTAEGGWNPVWSPDGTKIYYTGPNGHLWAAVVSLSPVFSVKSRAEVLPSGEADRFLTNANVHANFDVSPDGKRILYARTSGTRSELVVIHDWKYEVRERMKAPAR